jgi:hypothetical protein
MGKGNSHTPSIFAAIGLYHEVRRKAQLNQDSPAKNAEWMMVSCGEQGEACANPTFRYFSCSGSRVIPTLLARLVEDLKCTFGVYWLRYC